MTKTITAEKQFTFSLGDQVGFLSHPYKEGVTEAKISAYHHFTPPVMVIVAKHQKATYDVETGKQEKSYQCLYYSTTSGKFEENWFKEKQLKLVEQEKEKNEEILYSKYKDKSLKALQKELIGKQVILKTVDIELGKKNVYLDGKLGGQYLKEKKLLDFLPPLSTVIQVSSVQDYQKFDKNTGVETNHKNKYNLKIRWFNNKTAKFSEEEVPMVALKMVELNIPITYNPENTYLINEKLILEKNNGIEVIKQPHQYVDTVFKHYYYEYRFKNLFTGKVKNFRSEDINELSEKSFSELFENLSYEPVLKNEAFKKVDWEEKWFRILYIDRKANFSDRIIYVRKVIEVKPLENRYFLEANCLKRGGEIRNFHTDQIFSYKAISESFEEKLLNHSLAF